MSSLPKLVNQATKAKTNPSTLHPGRPVRLLPSSRLCRRINRLFGEQLHTPHRYLCRFTHHRLHHTESYARNPNPKLPSLRSRQLRRYCTSEASNAILLYEKMESNNNHNKDNQLHKGTPGIDEMCVLICCVLIGCVCVF